MKQKLGQHFLKNSKILQKIVGAVDVGENDTILEIGPGHGELTFPLVSECKKSNCKKIIAIEKDAELADQLLNRKLHVEIKTGDALKLLPKIITEEINNSPYKIVGNIPYSITGKLFRVIGEIKHKPIKCVFTIQKEVAERLCASPRMTHLNPSGSSRAGRGMNLLAASVQFWANTKIIATVPKKDFSPPPDVDSAIITLETKMGAKNDVNYYKMIKILFAQPRKTILNNIYDGFSAKIDKERISEMLLNINLNANLRSQNLDIATIKLISEKFIA